MSAAAPERADVEAELARVLASADFARNHGASNFLKFVVEETLDGRGDRLKAFTIATQALERKDDFDSQSNSAVRVQALRLRQMLAAWYEGPGAGSPVRIRLTPGSYKPEFERGGAAAPIAEQQQPPKTLDARRRLDGRRVFSALALSLTTFMLAMVGLMTGPASPPGSMRENAPPIPSLRVETAAGAPKTLVDLGQALELAFSAFDNVIVKKPDSGPPAPATNAYALALRPLEGGFAAELLRLSDRTVVWANRFALPGKPEALALQALELSQTVGDAYGLIDLDALRLLNDFDGMPRGFNCTLSAFAFLKRQTLDRLRIARDCLEIAVAANSRDDDARAMLAIVLVHTHMLAPPENDAKADLAQAQKLSQEAFDLAPRRARSFFARFVTLFAAERYDEAFAAARTALALNGNSTLFSRGIGIAYVLRGDMEAGLALLAPLVERTDDSSVALGATALAHLARGEKTPAMQLLARPGASERALALIVQLSLCGGDSACARERGDELRRNFPDVAADIGAALDRMGAAPAVKALLRDGLRESGSAAETLPGIAH